jgi:glucose-1-phosphate adenylyltransferase
VLRDILAGGKGTRMDVLCQFRPKPALPFAGTARVIDFSLSNCIHSQINNIAALVEYRRSHLEDYPMRWQSSNNLAGIFDALGPRSTSYRGTADAVYQNLAYLDPSSCQTFSLVRAASLTHA